MLAGWCSQVSRRTVLFRCWRRLRSVNGKEDVHEIMRCQEVRKRIQGYVLGELLDEEVVAMDKHLDRCDACREAVDEYLRAFGFSNLTLEREELLRLMRIPTPSREQVQAGVIAVLRAVQGQGVKTSGYAFTLTSAYPKSAKMFCAERLSILRKKVPTLWACALTVALVLLAVFVWGVGERYRVLRQQVIALTATVKELKHQNESLRQENLALRREIERVSSEREQVSRLLTEKQEELEKEIAKLQQENEKLKAKLLMPRIQPQVLVSLEDDMGKVALKSDGTLDVAGKAKLPSPLRELVYQFVTKGRIAPKKSVLVAMAALSSEEMKGVLRSAQDEGIDKPIPLSPVLTAVRSTNPILRWKQVAGVQEYKVRVADRSDKIVWEGSVKGQTQATLPSGILKRGQVYFWQVEAVAGERAFLSPIAGFWVLSEKELREVEDVERRYGDSALVRASIYASYGLFEEALVQVERLMHMNPDNPFVQMMLRNLRCQLGK